MNVSGTRTHKEVIIINIISKQLSMLDEIDGVKKLNNTDYTYKSHKLIFSSYELSVTQQRIISLGCKKIQPIYIEKRLTPNDLNKVLGAMQFNLIEISVSEFKKEYNIKSNNLYGYLQKEIDDLYNKSFNYFDENENEKLKKRRWVSSADFDRPNGCISITFNPDIILDLLVFKNSFVALLFDLSKDIRSKYPFRIYEILKCVSYLGKYKISIEEFKFLLDITDKYKDFGKLNAKVIKPSMEIINKYSDIETYCEIIRCGKNAKWLEFFINKKSNYKIKTDNSFKDKIPTAFSELQEELNKFNIELTSSIAEKMFNIAIEITKNKYQNMNPLDYIKEKIRVLDNYILNNNINDLIGFLIKALENDYKINNKNKTKIGFNNFESRKYNNDALEKALLGWDDNITIEDIVGKR